MESYLEKYTGQQPKVASKWHKAFTSIAWELRRGFVAILITASLPLLPFPSQTTKQLHSPIHTPFFSSLGFLTTFVILPVFQTLSFLLYLLWCSVISGLWCHYCDCFGVPQTMPILDGEFNKFCVCSDCSAD